MMQVFPKSFRDQLVLIIIVATLIPALLVAGILLSQIKQNAKQNVISKLEVQLKGDAEVIRNEVLLISSLLQQLSLDQSNVLAAENAVFGVYARNQLFRVTEAHPEIKLVQIYDTDLFPVESVPLNYEFMSLDFLFKELESANTDVQYKLFISQELGSKINEHAKSQITLNEFLVISVPLLKKNEANPQTDIKTGTLLAVIYLQDLLSLLDSQSSHKISASPIEAIPLEDEQPNILQTTTFQIGEQILSVAIEYDRTFLEVPIRRAYETTSLIILAILIVSIFVAFHFSRRFTRPFSNIRKLIGSYREGHFDRPTRDLKFQEFIQLSDVLAEMAAIIEKNQHDLEDRVENRTMELARANEELQQALETQKALQSHLVESEKMAQLGGLVAGISHEVNTPVGISLTAASSMRVFINELQSLTESGKLTRAKHQDLMNKCLECTEMVVSNLRRSADLISNFKDVAVSQVTSEKSEFCLQTFMQEIVSAMQPQTKKFNVKLILDIQANLIMNSYQGVIAQIFTNFIMNSLKHGFAPDEPHVIEIKAYVANNNLRLDYQDDGRGMEENVLGRIFEPFYTTKRGQGGTGLGMHIVYNLVTQKLDGRIESASQPGIGTQFNICLPKFHIAKRKNVLT